METLNVIKIGGNVIDDEKALHDFLAVFATLKGKKILVHGGGKVASELGKKLGIEPQLVNGRRITDGATLDVVCMVYAGLINKKIVAHLQAFSCHAIGLSGADANSIRTQKRAVKEVDYGFVGDLVDGGINTDFLHEIISKNYVPVIAPITHDGNGQLLNTNADTIASALAVALSDHYKVELNYCLEKRGVLKNVEDETSLIADINKPEYEQLKAEGIVSAGMIPKLDNAFEAIEKGVDSVTIGSAFYLKETINHDAHAATRLIA